MHATRNTTRPNECVLDPLGDYKDQVEHVPCLGTTCFVNMDKCDYEHVHVHVHVSV